LAKQLSWQRKLVWQGAQVVQVGAQLGAQLHEAEPAGMVETNPLLIGIPGGGSAFVT
jgi:hypothetical protein